jgi:L,D-transpeptidase ErfK/SrfK
VLDVPTLSARSLFWHDSCSPFDRMNLIPLTRVYASRRCDPRPYLAAVLAVALLAGCVAPPHHRPARARSTGLVTSPAHTPLRKISAVTTHLRRPSELPQLVGELQHYRVAPGETLLDIARQGGVGFRKLRDANPTIDEWEPRSGTELVVPSRWILPRTTARGLVVNVPEMRLYMFPAEGQPGERVTILTWPVGIGAEEAPSPLGPFTVLSKDMYPTWVVPDSIRRTMEQPRKIVPPGPDNPLGNYRIRLSRALYAIHGTNDPWTVGRLTTHGCIRLYPEDIATLYSLVERGTPGEFLYQPVKLGERAGRIYVEVHQDVYRIFSDLERHAFAEVAAEGLTPEVDPQRLRAAVRGKTGVPVDVSRCAEWSMDRRCGQRVADRPRSPTDQE